MQRLQATKIDGAFHFTWLARQVARVKVGSNGQAAKVGAEGGLEALEVQGHVVGTNVDGPDDQAAILGGNALKLLGQRVVA